MATVTEWIEGARPRTLPIAISPVLVGTGAAVGARVIAPGAALLALVVAVALIVGVNFANDYSDGVRGTDDNRVGPQRLVGSRAASPEVVRAAAFTAFGVAAVAGLVLVGLAGQWWLIAVGAVCILGAWYYTGGRRPYGYAGLGEVAVFVFFGPVAVLGTTVTQAGSVGTAALVGAAGCGLLACAVLVANNLRDIPGDEVAGKMTLAVRLGDRNTRVLWTVLAAAPFVLTLAAAFGHPALLVSLLALPVGIRPLRAVLGETTGMGLIPALAGTVALTFAWSLTTAVGLAVDGYVGI